MEKRSLKDVKMVSIVMCTYNGALFLREQLDTIVRQTYPIYEIIIQDDCSTDETIDILSQYREKYPNIKIWRNFENIGVNRNFFSVLHKARGEYIAISDQDDIWELDKIEKQIKKIGDNLLCFHYSKPFSTDGVPVQVDLRCPNYSLMRMIYFNMIPGHTMLINRRIMNFIVDENCYLYDALIALAATVMNQIAFVDEVLVHHRRYSLAYSYHSPTSNSKKIGNIISYMRMSYHNWYKNKSIVNGHFNVMFTLLQKYDGITQEKSYYDVLTLCDLYRKSSIISFMRSSYLCLKYKNDIFHTKDNSIIRSSLRALLHPILMCKYYQ